MSILSERAKSVQEMPIDGVFVIYGDSGSGKTELASTFPKTKEKPMLILDILEGGTGSISVGNRDNIQVVNIDTFQELDEVLTDVENGVTIDASGAKVPVEFSTIVIDSATQLEYLLKQYVLETNGKDQMNLNLWGQAKNGHDQMWNMIKYLNKKTGANMVVICLPKEVQDEKDPSFNKIIPNLMNSAAYGLCAKASFVWYTKVEKESVVDPKTQEVKEEKKFFTYIDAHPYLLTKCRKPKEVQIPEKVQNLSYDKFKKNVIDKIK